MKKRILISIGLFSDPFAIEQPSTSVPDIPPAPKRGGASRNSVGKGGLKATGGVNKRRGKAPGAGAGPVDDTLDPETRAHKEGERRRTNNNRERIRIRDINESLTELGRVVMTLRPKTADKPQTKLAVLNMAVDMITHLEKQVREKNMNPPVVALNHRADSQGNPTPPRPQFFVPSSASATVTSESGNVVNDL